MVKKGLEEDNIPEEKKHESRPKDDRVIEINFSKIFGRVGKNPWIAVSVVLLIVLIIVLVTGMGFGTEKVSAGTAAENLINFINAQGQGTATLSQDPVKEGALYQVVVNYQGQDIPVFVTLDGKYLISSPISLDGNSDTSDSGNVDSSTIVDVETGDAPVLGSKDAQVTIVEFSDFQCPYCAKFYNEAYQDIKEQYVDAGKAKIVFMDFPLTQIHPLALPAAESTRCVREQGGDTAFWKMHDKIFENQATLSEANLKSWAKALGYNIDSCLDSGKYEEAVLADESYGASIGVSGTPAFFVNGKLVSGALPFSSFKSLIDSELAESA